MQQTCSQCGFVSLIPAKFCRQCGAAMFAENESSEAATRNYGRQTPTPETPPTSHPFTSPTPQPPPSLADAFAPDTARLHNQPQANYGQPPVPMGMPPVNPAYPPTAPKSNWWKWLLGFALTTLLVCGGLSGLLFMRARDVVPHIQRQAKEAIEKAREEAERAAKEGDLPAPPGAPVPPPPPGKGMAPEFEKLTYPNAKITSRVNAFGQQVMEMKTSDSLAQVKAFYEKQLGAPVVESEDGNNKSLVFQKAPLMVTVGDDKRGSGQLSITIIRSGFIPQINKPDK